MTPRRACIIAASLCLALAWPTHTYADSAADIKQRIEQRYGVEILTHSPPRQHMRWTLLQPGDREALHWYLQIIEKELSLHHPTVLKNSQLSKLIFLRELQSFGDVTGGTFSAGLGELFFAVGYTDDESYIRQLFHHELYHMMQETVAGWHSSNAKWMLYNPPGWHYGRGGRAANRAAPYLKLDLGRFNDALPGFFNLYSRTAMCEDQAEVFTALFTPALRTVVERQAARDKGLELKLKHMQRFIDYYKTDRTYTIEPGTPAGGADYLQQYLKTITISVVHDDERGLVRWIQEPSHQAFINETHLDDWRPLHFAAAYGRPAGAHAMIQAGAEVDAVDVDGLTAMHLAAAGGHEKVVQILISAGADRFPKDNWGHTPWDLSVHRQVTRVEALRPPRPRR